METEELVEGLRVSFAFAPKVSLALHQNAVPLLRELTVENRGRSPVENVVVTLASEPSFLIPRTWRIAAIGPGQRYHVTDRDVQLDAGHLARLTEAETISAMCAARAGEQMDEARSSFELLPRNQWGGIGHVPEMVAAFVQPNDPAVDRILKSAAETLERFGLPRALDGYKGGPKRAWEIASAIWTSIGGLGLDYALPPASFEQAGQKVRSPTQILDGGLATCLDTTLLFAACLEQAGLHPIVVFTRGHAFAGLWLKSEDFTNAAVDDVTALRKRVKLKQIVVFETTLATSRPCPTFGHAIDRGASQIADAAEAPFELLVDVARARMQRIRPLAAPSVDAPKDGVAAEPAPAVPPAFERAPDLPADAGGEGVEDAPTTPQGRLDRWHRKLLDLSLRNGLLNFRAGKRAIPIEAPEPGRLEDLLADGKRLRLLPRPDLMDGADPRSRRIHEARQREDVRRGNALDALERLELLVDLGAEELETRLVEVYRASRAALQEGGANTLFLALGFLRWSRDDKDHQRYSAPLVLLPVTLERKSVRSGFTLVLHDDEPRFNPTLIQMLRQDFRLTLPIAEGELPKDESGLDIARIWSDVARAVTDIRGWEVTEEVVLSTFSFAKYLMWKDLVDRTDQLKENAVVRHLIDTPREPFRSDVAFPDTALLDRDYGPEQTFCPLQADSSQLSAIMAAAKGKDFVLIGPPGTGKSQTIANLIAQCLAERKTVLFVSEKIAALDVVYRRLREVGLGEFCLELHSSKARKLEVLQQLREAWDARGGVDAAEWADTARRVKALRDELNTYVERLHVRRGNGMTVHGAIGRVVAGRDIIHIGLSWPSPDAHDQVALDALRDLVDRIDATLGPLGDVASHPLAAVAHAEWSPSWQQGVVTMAEAAARSAEALGRAAEAFVATAGLPPVTLDARTLSALVALADVLPRAAGRDWTFVLRPDAGRLAERLAIGVDLVRRHRAALASLPIPWAPDLCRDAVAGCERLRRHRALTAEFTVPFRDAGLAGTDAARLRADWSRAEASIWPLGALRRRAVTRALAQLVEGGEGAARPAMPADLDRLVERQRIEAEVAAAGHLAEVDGLPWSGLATNVEHVAAALALQVAIDAARAGRPWTEDGLGPIADGHCGATLARALAALREASALEREMADLASIEAPLAGLWAGARTDLAEAEAALAFRQALASALAGLALDAERMAALRTPIERLLGPANGLLDAAGPIAWAGAALAAAFTEYRAAAEPLHQALAIAEGAASTALGVNLAELAEGCRRIVANAPRLNAWCAWRKARNEALAHGLAPLVAAIEAGGIPTGGARTIFDVAYARWWLDAVVDGDEALRGFVSSVHEKRIEDFRRLDARIMDLTKAHVRAALCAELPRPDDVARTAEWGLLKREMEKKRRHIPLRELIRGLPTALTRLTPCLLMSPLSIAQYLATETARFDLVVFDEASQIPVWDAIGAIARGKQVVMVGDPKQLPPTSFFARAESDDDDLDTETDLESILDECMGAGLPTRNLSWHYRSRHESLIAFSNHRYYGGGLVTFPSPVTDDRAVSFHLVADGIYERGGARINKPEAHALVADLVARLKDPEFCARELSVGVVTFNAEQQRLIEDLLDAERRKDPAIEPHFAETRIEPVFVKNLENVQGDERDVMYFSITYGPPGPGLPPSMNFGPMNGDGGQRRLNVAITRARHELRVFSSLTPDQIDLSRTQAEGVRDLKHFLEFAERGPRALSEAVRGSVGEFESPFEEAVAAALAARGWRVHPQVGVSAFRIDLGVVDPDLPGRYLAGVECDGATYHRSATARDRDKLRESVLRGLGWEIVRIWSTDWWVDATSALDKVHARLTGLLETVRAARAAGSNAAEADAGECDGGVGDGAQTSSTARGEVFREAQLEPTGSAEHFFDRDYEPNLCAMIEAVVAVEGPVGIEVAARRIARAHGWHRTGARIVDRVETLARRVARTVPEEGGTFLWPKDVEPGSWPVFRAPANGVVRPVEEISLAELVALARSIRVEGLAGEPALVAMARRTGLARLRAVSRARFERALELATKEASTPG
jgi:very-short-patch-repair endonuclease